MKGLKMERLCEEQLNELVKQISMKHFHKPFVHKATYNYRLRTTGGRYMLNTHNIEINPKYVLEMKKQDYVDIIKHELCHYHLHIEGKGYKHEDQEFRQLLLEVNAPMHCKPLPSEQNKRKLQYRCKSCGLIYERIRRVNTKKYRCGRCYGEINKLSEKG